MFNKPFPVRLIRDKNALWQRRGRNVLKLSAVALMSLAVGGAAAGAFKAGWLGDPWGSFEKETLNPGFRSGATPGILGLAFQRLSISSGPRRLDGFLVPSSPRCAEPTAVLIFHGRGETIADWVKSQARFHDACITSMVFDYSGHGRSDGPGTIDNLNTDAVAAYRDFIRRTPNNRRCLFSHSMGGAPMLFAATSPDASPDCIVIASPFSSLRAMAEHGSLPKMISSIMPDVWDNISRIRNVHAPVLWIHSRTDQTVPTDEGRSVFEAAPDPKMAVMIDRYDHNAIYQAMPSVAWNPMLAFIRGNKVVPGKV